MSADAVPTTSPVSSQGTGSSREAVQAKIKCITSPDSEPIEEIHTLVPGGSPVAISIPGTGTIKLSANFLSAEGDEGSEAGEVGVPEGACECQDRADKEAAVVSNTLKQIVPLRKMLSRIRKKVEVLSTNISGAQPPRVDCGNWYGTPTTTTPPQLPMSCGPPVGGQNCGRTKPMPAIIEDPPTHLQNAQSGPKPHENSYGHPHSDHHKGGYGHPHSDHHGGTFDPSQVAHHQSSYPHPHSDHHGGTFDPSQVAHHQSSYPHPHSDHHGGTFDPSQVAHHQSSYGHPHSDHHREIYNQPPPAQQTCQYGHPHADHHKGGYEHPHTAHHESPNGHPHSEHHSQNFDQNRGNYSHPHSEHHRGSYDHPHAAHHESPYGHPHAEHHGGNFDQNRGHPYGHPHSEHHNRGNFDQASPPNTYPPRYQDPPFEDPRSAPPERLCQGPSPMSEGVLTTPYYPTGPYMAPPKDPLYCKQPPEINKPKCPPYVTPVDMDSCAKTPCAPCPFRSQEEAASRLYDNRYTMKYGTGVDVTIRDDAPPCCVPQLMGRCEPCATMRPQPPPPPQRKDTCVPCEYRREPTC